MHVPLIMPPAAQGRSLVDLAKSEVPAQDVAVSLQTAFDHPKQGEPTLGRTIPGRGCIVMTPEETILGQNSSLTEKWALMIKRVVMAIKRDSSHHRRDLSGLDALRTPIKRLQNWGHDIRCVLFAATPNTEWMFVAGVGPVV